MFWKCTQGNKNLDTCLCQRLKDRTRKKSIMKNIQQKYQLCYYVTLRNRIIIKVYSILFQLFLT